MMRSVFIVEGKEGEREEKTSRRAKKKKKPRVVLLRYSSLLDLHNGSLDIYFKSPAHADIFPRPSFGPGQPENIKWCLHTFL